MPFAHPRARGDLRVTSSRMTPRIALAALAVVLAGQAAIIGLALFWGPTALAALVAVVSLATGALLVTTAYSVLFGAPFVPTGTDRVRTMLRLAGLRPGEKLVDLGSGDGRIVIAAAKAGMRAEGWEVNPYLWLISVLRIRHAGVHDRARVRLGSYWPASMRDADVVTLFLITSQMGSMERKLRAELRPGSRVVSYAFTFPEWGHEDAQEGVYLYRQP